MKVYLIYYAVQERDRNKSSQSNWEEHVAVAPQLRNEVPHWFQWDAPYLPPKLTLPLR